MVVEPVESLEVTPPPEDLGPALQQVGVLLRPKDPAVRDVGEAGLYPPQLAIRSESIYTPGFHKSSGRCWTRTSDLLLVRQAPSSPQSTQEAT